MRHRFDKGARDFNELRVIAIGEKHSIDALRVDELPCGTRANRADADDENRRHRNSGPSSSRQPPLVGGTPPLPRKRATRPMSAASPKTNSKRRNAFTRRSVSTKAGGGRRQLRYACIPVLGL